MVKKIQAQEIKRRDVVIAFDISGNGIKLENLKAVLNTFEVIVESYDYIGHIILADDDVRLSIALDDIDDLSKLTLNGNKSSDYRPVFDFIKEKQKEENLDIFKVYYITDGFGIFPNKEEFDTIWICANDYGQFPFGEVSVIK